ncbi:hypothetical protein G6F46_003515 [Rhizopus delemar]|uniref:tRNA-intron lyase n=1 Tax=Rhizopus delemar TaxID=936053 RepID=A0A9P6Z919_9FUNG|nr:hypothetical protein G6F43_011753 [Rhizopus delemar]KAG1466623.1 hypothetical protein G6F55_000373 [Rhizopus delemar]KAG1510725.1 hypothetical protein G6F52_010828 [Rhizopus delemar]KAG1572903.1 hypothetical protein G6F50_003334 [Rhizopus delemar]KAG1618981.1 hypothetical protein G6F46_003515 [Rhizopus delemar]
MKKQDTNISTPLPIEVYATKTLGESLKRILLSYYHYYFKSPSYQSTFLEFGNFVWIHHEDRDKIYQSGFFGKGDLSRSQPTWKTRTIEQNKQSLEEITVERRKKRREKKKGNTIASEHDQWEADELLKMTKRKDPEKLCLDVCEAYFLKYALGALEIKDKQGRTLSTKLCWSKFCENNASFHYMYAVYHYYRSLGWVPKNGIKFGVDFGTRQKKKKKKVKLT